MGRRTLPFWNIAVVVVMTFGIEQPKPAAAEEASITTIDEEPDWEHVHHDLLSIVYGRVDVFNSCEDAGWNHLETEYKYMTMAYSVSFRNMSTMAQVQQARVHTFPQFLIHELHNQKPALLSQDPEVTPEAEAPSDEYKAATPAVAPLPPAASAATPAVAPVPPAASAATSAVTPTPSPPAASTASPAVAAVPPAATPAVAPVLLAATPAVANVPPAATPAAPVQYDVCCV